MKRIGIYGGSFDPIHKGHELAITEFIRLMDLDELLLIPAGQPPHKSLSSVSPDREHRLAMVKLATAHIKKVHVCELEMNRLGKSFTSDTLEEIKSLYPDSRLFLLMGTDMLLSFDTWHAPEKICELAELCVMSRSAAMPLTAECFVLKAEDLRKRFHAKIRFLENRFMEISSTTVRRMVMLGSGGYYLHPEVYGYILANGLYQISAHAPYTTEALKEIVKPLYEEKRYCHACGCMETAVLLGEKWGENAENAARAGILHDITKALGPEQQLILCEKYGIITSDYAGDQGKILHGPTAAGAARCVFSENDAVCSAIYWHTTGHANMSLLEKIVYLADYIEPNRRFDGVDALRSLAFSNIDEAVILGINMTIELLVQNKKSLNKFSLEARDYLLHKGDSKK